MEATFVGHNPSRAGSARAGRQARAPSTRRDRHHGRRDRRGDLVGLDEPPPTAETVFEIGSITKPFTAVLLADMHLRGEVDLDDPLSRRLDAPRPGVARARANPARARHPQERPAEHAPPARSPGAAVRPRPSPSATPGATWMPRVTPNSCATRARAARRVGRVRYSSIGFGLLGEALAAAAGMPYEDCCASAFSPRSGCTRRPWRPARSRSRDTHRVAGPARRSRT